MQCKIRWVRLGKVNMLVHLFGRNKIKFQLMSAMWELVASHCIALFRPTAAALWHHGRVERRVTRALPASQTLLSTLFISLSVARISLGNHPGKPVHGACGISCPPPLSSFQPANAKGAVVPHWAGGQAGMGDGEGLPYCLDRKSVTSTAPGSPPTCAPAGWNQYWCHEISNGGHKLGSLNSGVIVTALNKQKKNER